MWDLPLSVDIGGKEYAIRNKCDYRVVLDVIKALNDEELEIYHRIQCALFIFYEDLTGVEDMETAVKEMFKIISYGQDDEETEHKPRSMDWEHDFPQIAPPISRVLGYDVRTPNKFTHWWTFLGGYMEIGECSFATTVSIRNKKLKGKKLEKWEEEYYRENRKTIDLPQKLTAEEQDWLDSDW